MGIKELQEKVEKEMQIKEIKTMDDCRNTIVYNIKNKMKTGRLFRKKTVTVLVPNTCNIENLANPKLLKEPLDIKLINDDLLRTDRIFLLCLGNNYYNLHEYLFATHKKKIIITEIKEEKAKYLLSFAINIYK